MRIKKKHKRQIALFLTILNIIALPASAAEYESGDIIGEVYSTDIIAYIDDMPIRSFNIGGQTVVPVEELREYGFEVNWDADQRKLSVESLQKPASVPDRTLPKAAPGTEIGKVYFSDITLNWQGMEYQKHTYNIGGITCLALEDLGSDITQADGYSEYAAYYKWDAAERTIRLYTLRPGDFVSTPFGRGEIGKLYANYHTSAYAQNKDGRGSFLMYDVFDETWQNYIALSDIPSQWGIKLSAAEQGCVLQSDDSSDMVCFRWGTYGHPQQISSLLVGLKLPVSVNGQTVVPDRVNAILELPSGSEETVYFSTEFLQQITNRSFVIED